MSRARSWSTVVIVALLACVPFAVDDWTLTNLSRMMALAMLAVSVCVLTGTAGLPSLGQVAPFAVGAYLTVNIAEAGITVGPLQILIAAAAAAAFSAVVGLVVIRTRGAAFLMVTLAVGVLTKTAAGQWYAVTGGTDGTSRVPAAEPWWGVPPLIDDWNVYWYSLGVATAVVATTVAVLRGWPGTLVRGTRDNEIRMRASGHPVARYLWITYVAAGAIAGIGGAMLVTSRRYISPDDVDLSVSALVLLAVVIGGTTSIGGALAGTALVVLVEDWFTASLPGQGPLLLGVLFIATVYLLPNGISGLWGRSSPPLRQLLRRVGPPPREKEAA